MSEPADRRRLPMGQPARLFMFVCVFVVPFAGPLYVMGYGLHSSPLARLPLVAAIALVSLAITVMAAAVMQPVLAPGSEPRLIKGAFANIPFIIFDVAAFALLVYENHSSAHRCLTGPACELYPLGWLSLAGMHFCQVALGFYIWIKSPR